MACRNCRTEVKNGADWCPHCGEDLRRYEKRLTRIFYAVIGVIAIALFFFFLMVVLGFIQQV